MEIRLTRWRRAARHRRFWPASRSALPGPALQFSTDRPHTGAPCRRYLTLACVGVLLLQLVSPARSQPAPAALPDEPPAQVAGAELGGRVFLGSADAPLAGVDVLVRGPAQEWRVTTDGEGRFRLDGLPPGSYEVVVDASVAGGASTTVTLGADGAEVTLTIAGEIIEITGRYRSEADQIRESSEAVQVVTTEVAQRESADLGEVLARSEGIAVQRSGGLGSDERFSLNGLTDDQIRFFVDGVPLEAAGYGPSLANIPVNLIERIEVFRGVVPVRFGADALGGALNLVTAQQQRGSQASASYQLGSFGTHRISLSGRGEHQPSGAYVRASGFYDTTDNDYEVDVEVPNEVGRLEPARVRRFHDDYRAMGASLEVGRISASGDEHASLRGYVHSFSKDLQHNQVMAVPYGDVTHGGRTAGAIARYQRALAPDLTLSAVLGYAYRRTDFEDLGVCIYDWFGTCIGTRRQPGEIGGAADDLSLFDHHGLGRFHLDWSVREGHALRLSLAPSLLSRTGENHLAIPGASDPLDAERDLYTAVGGLEYQLGDIDDPVENTLFVKVYGQIMHAERPQPGGAFDRADRNTLRAGAGDGVRYRFVDWLWAKASYELATRLPTPEEVFGDGVTVIDNLALAPETSHNLNLGLAADVRDTTAGAFYLDVAGFGRFARNLIVFLGTDKSSGFYNVDAARALGVQASGRWQAPGDHVSVHLGGTWQDVRNASPEGAYGEFDGDRLPHRPWLFGHARATVHANGLLRDHDELSLSLTTRYVHGFFRGWESVGLMDSKQAVPSQLVHGATANYAWEWQQSLLSFSLEAHNLTNAQLFDLFGAQRPGRALFAKLIATFR